MTIVQAIIQIHLKVRIVAGNVRIYLCQHQKVSMQNTQRNVFSVFVILKDVIKKGTLCVALKDAPVVIDVNHTSYVQPMLP